LRTTVPKNNSEVPSRAFGEITSASPLRTINISRGIAFTSAATIHDDYRCRCGHRRMGRIASYHELGDLLNFCKSRRRRPSLRFSIRASVSHNRGREALPEPAVRCPVSGDPLPHAPSARLPL
jgi:hypothetical protein